MGNHLEDLKGELATVSPQVEALDAQLTALRDERAAQADTLTSQIVTLQEERDGLRTQEMALLSQIGQIEGIPELRVGD